MRSLSGAAAGMMAQQLHVEVISNNIANTSKAGYKRRRPVFQDTAVPESPPHRRFQPRER